MDTLRLAFTDSPRIGCGMIKTRQCDDLECLRRRYLGIEFDRAGTKRFRCFAGAERIAAFRLGLRHIGDGSRTGQPIGDMRNSGPPKPCSRSLDFAVSKYTETSFWHFGIPLESSLSHGNRATSSMADAGTSSFSSTSRPTALLLLLQCVIHADLVRDGVAKWPARPRTWRLPAPFCAVSGGSCRPGYYKHPASKVGRNGATF